MITLTAASKSQPSGWHKQNCSWKRTPPPFPLALSGIAIGGFTPDDTAMLSLQPATRVFVPQSRQLMTSVRSAPMLSEQESRTQSPLTQRKQKASPRSDSAAADTSLLVLPAY